MVQRVSGRSVHGRCRRARARRGARHGGARGAPGDRAADHGWRIRRRDPLGDHPGGLLQVDRQARLPNGAAASPLRIEGLEGEPGRGAFLDHHDDAGPFRFVHLEAALTTTREMANDWEGKSVLVLGLGDTGLSCIRWLARRGARLRAADTREAPPALGAVRAGFPAVRVELGAFDEALLAGVDAIAASPGIALREPLLRAAVSRGIEVVGDVEIFAREVPHIAPGARVLGITGTNGKSTVTALAGAMGRAARFRTTVAGNIGLPVLDALREYGERARGASAESDLFVIELSSYQLETTANLALDAAAMLNVSQDHLDRYDSMQGYARAKERIFINAAARIVNRDDAWSRAMGGERQLSFGLGEPRSEREWGLDRAQAVLRRGDEDLLAVKDMGMQGLHNAANALAAHALVSSIGAPRAAP